MKVGDLVKVKLGWPHNRTATGIIVRVAPLRDEPGYLCVVRNLDADRLGNRTHALSRDLEVISESR